MLVLAVSRPALAQNLARMEEVIRGHVRGSTFMGSVLVARDAEIILNKGYGFANVEWQIPNSPTTKFRLGSLTKQFTAASILLLAERGRLLARGSRQAISAGRPVRVGRHHDLPSADSHVWTLQLHRAAGLRCDDAAPR